MIFIIDAKISYAVFTLVSSPSKVVNKNHISHCEVQHDGEELRFTPRMKNLDSDTDSTHICVILGKSFSLSEYLK